MVGVALRGFREEMEGQEQAGGWNPIVVLALHCHNVQKSLAI